jgi:hypothetical protein
MSAMIEQLIPQVKYLSAASQVVSPKYLSRCQMEKNYRLILIKPGETHKYIQNILLRGNPNC